ncbi:MAG: methyltransferase domain-containing protein [Bacteroidetes bacterium]|nr:methyltransferase domain-containing protein [Bacteroidota bacterium]
MPNTEPFDTYREEYDNWFVNNRSLYLAELHAVRRLLPTSCFQAMEVGVGTGQFAVPLGIRLGIEPSLPMAARAMRQGVHVASGIAEMLPVADVVLDCVLLVTTICFVDNVVQSFKEISRVLKPGGTVIVGFVDRESELGKSYERRKQASRFYGTATFYSSEEVLQHLTDGGFLIQRVVQTLIPGNAPSVVTDGYGNGAFVTIRATKP